MMMDDADATLPPRSRDGSGHAEDVTIPPSASTTVGSDDQATVPPATTHPSPDDDRTIAPSHRSHDAERTVPPSTGSIARQAEDNTIPPSSHVAGQVGHETRTIPPSTHVGSPRDAKTIETGRSRHVDTRAETQLKTPESSDDITEVIDSCLKTSRISVLRTLATQGDIPHVHDGESRYSVEKAIAQGGMGSVLLIKDHDLGRQSALKVMRGDRRNAAMTELFLSEAQITAQLEHPNIVPVHDILVLDDGSLTFTMKLVDGRSLGSLIRNMDKESSPLDEHQRLMIFLKVLDGIGHAHAKGVIHRDIKPDNIMVGNHGEVLIVDWGIALATQRGSDPVQSVRTRDDASHTMTGTQLGTIWYAPPEQVQYDPDRMGPWSDIHALGETLAELLTGRRRLPSQTNRETLQSMIMHGRRTSMDAMAPDMHPDMRAIIHKATAVSIHDRYQTCGAFSEDIQRYIAGKAVLARRLSWMEQGARWVWRHRMKMASGLGVIGIAVGSAWTVSWMRAVQARADIADMAKSISETADYDSLLDARRRVAGILAIIPEDADAHALERRIVASMAVLEDQRNRAIKEEAARKAGTERAMSLMASAAEYARTHQWDQGLEAVTAAWTLEPGNPEIASLRDEITTAISNRNRTIRERDADDALRRVEAWIQTVTWSDHQQVRTAIDQTSEIERILAAGIYSASAASVQSRYERIRDTLLQENGFFESTERAKGLLNRSMASRGSEAVQFADQAIGVLPYDPRNTMIRTSIIASRDRGMREITEEQEGERLAHAMSLLQEGQASSSLEAAKGLMERALLVVPGSATEAKSRIVASMENIRERMQEAAIESDFQKRLDQAKVHLSTYRSERTSIHDMEGQLAITTQRASMGDDASRKKRDEIRDTLMTSRDRKISAIEEAWSLISQHGSRPESSLIRQAYAEYLVDTINERRKNREPIGHLIARLSEVDQDGVYRSVIAGTGQIRSSMAMSLQPLVISDDGHYQEKGGTDDIHVQPWVWSTLPSGPWRLRTALGSADIVIEPGSASTWSWPTRQPPAIPGVRWTPVPVLAGRPWWSSDEITHQTWSRFLNDPGIFPRFQSAWSAKVTGASAEREPLPYVPRDVFNATSWRQVLWQFDPPPEGGIDRSDVVSIRPSVADAPLPVSSISQADAMASAAWVSSVWSVPCRLPTRQEWQWMVGSNDPMRWWSWGPMDAPRHAAFRLPGPCTPGAGSDIGPFGQRHLSGNIREWTSDPPGFQGRVMVVGGSWADSDIGKLGQDAMDWADPLVTHPTIGVRWIVMDDAP